MKEDAFLGLWPVLPPVALPAADVTHPGVLLLDEPTTEADPKARREFWDESTHPTA